MVCTSPESRVVCQMEESDRPEAIEATDDEPSEAAASDATRLACKVRPSRAACSAPGNELHQHSNSRSINIRITADAC